MTAIQTTVHVGSDGMLRLAVPIQERDRDLTVTVTFDPTNRVSVPAANGGSDLTAERQRLVAAGIRVPTSRASTVRMMPPLDLAGRPVAETLIEDRR
jgi:hypothetical protein